MKRLKDISSSSSEEESDGEAENEKEEEQQNATRNAIKGVKRFECPADFVLCSHNLQQNLALEKLNRSSTELWLIKAPAEFSAESFSGKKIPLIGFQTLDAAKDGCKKRYNVLSTAKEIGNANLLVPLPNSERLVCAPPFHGIINIGESFGESGTHRPLKPIPASPAPTIPAGLKQRFQPFGATLPASTGPSPGKNRQHAVGGVSPVPPRRIREEVTETDFGTKKKKKKKKKSKRWEEEYSVTREEMVVEQKPIKEETETPKKKKKKKSKELEEQKVTVKQEPVEEESEPSKREERRRKGNEHLEGSLRVKEEPPEAAGMPWERRAVKEESRAESPAHVAAESSRGHKKKKKKREDC
uniref:RNA polymerase I subunit G n=1 Tax=Latimeria chalumnae TaxID=7897 RepID=H3B1A2_LATCH